jgi:hypothetical protein
MKTTISISDSLLELAKKASRERRSTPGEVIEGALQASLAPRPKSSLKKRPTLVTSNGSGLHEGVDLDSSTALLEVMES